MILDVCCADKPRGDVNVDLFRYNVETPNFVIADAHSLPFRNNAFDKASCFCGIEHMSKPSMVLGEIFRVSKSSVSIRYDSFFSIYNWIGSGHKNIMVRERFVKLPRAFFVLSNRLALIKPIKFLLRKGGFFIPSMYDKEYCPKISRGEVLEKFLEAIRRKGRNDIIFDRLAEI